VRNTIRTSILMLAVMTGITGIVYPLGVTLLSRVLFHDKAEGSITRVNGRAVGSSLIGQSFTNPRYFWGRPSATSPPYNAAASTGSNLGPSNPALGDSVRARIERLRRADPGNAEPIPVDLVTSSGSGLDPHISPAAALYQVPRVSRLRGLDETVVRSLVRRFLEPRTFGLLGEPRVNVLKLNLALDGLGESR
jgi:K+-transporting ATPase ATPase C chain